MNGAFLDGSLVLNRGNYHYYVDFEGKIIIIRAGIGAMLVLKRELDSIHRHLKPYAIVAALKKLNMSQVFFHAL
jgi:hypothetical protein